MSMLCRSWLRFGRTTKVCHIICFLYAHPTHSGAAWHTVAYKRFTDIVPLAVDRMILRGLDKGIRQALFDGLGLGGQNGPQTCAELLQEPSTVVARRTDLQTRRDRLSSGAYICILLIFVMLIGF
jgi:hypothetical protein